MVSFKLSLLSRCCLLAITTGGLSVAAEAQSPWRDTGSVMDVTSGYSSTTAGDYPLFVDGTGSVLQSTTDKLIFNTVGNNLFAALAQNGGTLRLQDAALSTAGTLAHGVEVNAGHLAMVGGSVSVSGQTSSAIRGEKGADLNLSGVNIATSGPSNIGVQLIDGTLKLSQAAIQADSAQSAGIELAYSTPGLAQATIDNTTVSTQGVGTLGGLLLGNGRVDADHLTLISADKNRGAEVYNANGGHGVMVLNNSAIQTEKGDGVYILQGDVTLNNTTVSTQTGTGLNVNSHGTVETHGGSVTTSGDYADGVWVSSASSSANVEGTKFSTQGIGAIAFDAQYGPATLKNSELTTSGAGSYGLYTENQVQGDGVKVNTTGNNAIGVYAARGGNITLADSQVSTSGSSAAGLLAYPGSTITADRLALTTSGSDAQALWTREGTLKISDSTVATSGKNAAGLIASDAGTGQGNRVALDNVALTSAQGSAVRAIGTDLDLALSNKTHLSGGNGILLETTAGSAADKPGTVKLTADNQVTLEGDIRAATQNQVNVALTHQSSLTGSANNVDELLLDSSSVWNMTGSSVLGAFSHDGMVNMQHTGSAFSTLTMDSLSGNGGFAMNTDLASMSGDLIVINGAAEGNHQLAIKNSGKEPGKTDDALTVVETGGGAAAFALKGGAVDAGTWQYELQHRGDNWVLAQKGQVLPPDPTPDPDPDPKPDSNPDSKPDSNPNSNPDSKPDSHPDNNPGTDPVIDPVLTPTAAAAIGLFNATPTVWYGELTTLRTRLGEVREGKQQGGAWVRLLGSQYNVSDRAGVGYQQSQTGVSVGVDGVTDYDSVERILGVFSGYSKNSLDFTGDSTGSINSFFIGAYNTWLWNTGWYVDTVVKANNFDSSADVRMSDGEKTKGGYSTPGFGLSVETGRQYLFDAGWFVEPSVQLSALWVKGQSYEYDNGLQAASQQATSKQAALNAVAGRKFTLDNGMMLQPWLRMAAIQEFSDNNAVSINGNGFTNDMSGLRGE